eukprot:1179549-Prorocentrum_minimum.AAC.1
MFYFYLFIYWREKSSVEERPRFWEEIPGVEYGGEIVEGESKYLYLRAKQGRARRRRGGGLWRPTGKTHESTGHAHLAQHEHYPLYIGSRRTYQCPE